MPNDAKLGLVVGVGLVIAFAVLFFRKVPEPYSPQLEGGSIPVPQGSAAPSRGQIQSVDKRTSALPADPQIANPGPVAPPRGNLMSLAPGHSAHAENATASDRIDRALLRTPDPLPAASVLASPDLSEPPASMAHLEP
jgi:hypothetical protein